MATKPRIYGCPLVTDDEVTVAALALERESGFLLARNAARNLASSALIAVRRAHYDEARSANLAPFDAE